MDGDDLDQIMTRFNEDMLKLLSEPSPPLTYEETLKPPPQWWVNAVARAIKETEDARLQT